MAQVTHARTEIFNRERYDSYWKPDEARGVESFSRQTFSGSVRLMGYQDYFGVGAPGFGRNASILPVLDAPEILFGS
jgi:hypothetical protein